MNELNTHNLTTIKTTKIKKKTYRSHTYTHIYQRLIEQKIYFSPIELDLHRRSADEIRLALGSRVEIFYFLNKEVSIIIKLVRQDPIYVLIFEFMEVKPLLQIKNVKIVKSTFNLSAVFVMLCEVHTKDAPTFLRKHLQNTSKMIY